MIKSELSGTIKRKKATSYSSLTLKFLGFSLKKKYSLSRASSESFHKKNLKFARKLRKIWHQIYGLARKFEKSIRLQFY